MYSYKSELQSKLFRENLNDWNEWGGVKLSSLQPIGWAAVTFGPPTGTVEYKLLSNFLKRKQS